MSDPMFNVQLTPYRVDGSGPVDFLVTIPREDEPRLVALLIDGKERKNKHWLAKSPCCDRNLFYIGWVTELGWFLRWKCPECGAESMTMYPGWKSPKPASPGNGRGDMRYSTRRERSGY